MLSIENPWQQQSSFFEIPARLLTETARQIAPSLSILLKHPYVLTFYPATGNLLILYPSIRSETKVLERSVFINIKDHVFIQIHSCQHGFISGRSFVTQLVETLSIIGRQLNFGNHHITILLICHRRLQLRERIWIRR